MSKKVISSSYLHEAVEAFEIWLRSEELVDGESDFVSLSRVVIVEMAEEL